MTAVRRPHRLLTTLAIAAAAALAAAACGIPQDRHPTVLPGGVVNGGLGTTTTTTAPAPTPAVPVTVFFVRAEHVVPVVRTTTQPDIAGVLHLLLAGPSESEVAGGLRTAISGQTGLPGIRPDGSSAVIDLSKAFVEVGGQEQILALAQVVLTAAALPGITSVRFSLEGQPVEVPRADGTLSAGPMTAADYAALREPPAPPAPPAPPG